MRKLTRNKKEIMTLENINSSCACVAYCVDGSAAKEYYAGIQEHLARTGDPTPSRVKKNI